jgi:hypothetical protein
LAWLSENEVPTDPELQATVMLPLGAGFETMVSLLGNTVVVLNATRDQ